MTRPADLDLQTLLAIWVPHILLCLVMFWVLTCRSAQLIVRSHSVRSSPTLVLIYLAIDIILLCLTLMPLSEIFPGNHVIGLFWNYCGIIEDEAVYVLCFLFLSRVVRWLRNVAPEEKNRFLTCMLCGCWILLGVHMGLIPVIAWALQEAYMSTYFLLSNVTILAFNLVVFLILAVEYRRTKGVAVFLQEPLLTAYFGIQMSAQLLGILVNAGYICGVPTREEDYVLNAVFTYLFTLLYGIMPSVVVYKITSKGYDTAVRNEESVRLYTNNSGCEDETAPQSSSSSGVENIGWD